MVPAPHSLGATSIPSGVHLSLWQAGWLGHLPVCVLLVCLCLGEVSRGPSPRGPRSVYAEAPKLALCPCVLALWFCLCVYACVFLGAVARVSLCRCGCALAPLSLRHLCVRLGVYVRPSVGAVPWLSQRERGSTAAPPINLCLTASFSACAESSGGQTESDIRAPKDLCSPSDLPQPPTPSQALHPLHRRIHVLMM